MKQFLFIAAVLFTLSVSAQTPLVKKTITMTFDEVGAFKLYQLLVAGTPSVLQSETLPSKGAQEINAFGDSLLGVMVRKSIEWNPPPPPKVTPPAAKSDSTAGKK